MLATAGSQMLCSHYQLTRQAENRTEVLLLPCRSWQCDYCQPGRKNQLKAVAASGEPNICLTLTINVATGETPSERYRILHNSWKILAKRILRQFKLPAEKRWTLKTEDGHEYQDIVSYRVTRNTSSDKITALHYMAFAEETKQKEPHLHILLRQTISRSPGFHSKCKNCRTRP